MTSSPTEFRFQARVMDIRPRITRMFSMSGDCTLERLHRVLQILFGWRDCHLHQFTIGGRAYGTPDDLDDSRHEVREEREVRLHEVLHQGRVFLYEYDFGDLWKVKLRVEDVLPADQVPPIRCLGGQRAGPPEDCRGVNGYDHLIRVLADPHSEEHVAMRKWVGRHFDPEHFDVEAANRVLARRFPGSRRPVPAASEPQPYDPSVGPPRLEHLRLDKLNLRQQMVVALREGPMALEELAERLERAGVTLTHGTGSLVKAWRREPPVRRRVDGRLEVDTDHPSFEMAWSFIEHALPRARVEPPLLSSEEVDGDAPLTWDELEAPLQVGMRLPRAWSVRRRLILILDARGEASHDELREDHVRLWGSEPKGFSHFSFESSAFHPTAEGRVAIVPTDAEVVELRRFFRAWWASHQAEARSREQTKARAAERAKRREMETAELRARFEVSRRAVIRLFHHGQDVCGSVLWLPDMRIQRFQPGTRPALRETLRSIVFVFGLDPRADFERLDIEPEGQRLVDISPPFRSATVDGRQIPFTVAEAIAMSVPTDPPLTSPKEAERLWQDGNVEALLQRADHDVGLLFAFWRHVVENGFARRTVEGVLEQCVYVDWDVGAEYRSRRHGRPTD